MSERIEKGIWPHPPLKYSELVDLLVKTLEVENWFPYEWRPTPGEPIREGGIIEKQSHSKYHYHTYRHSPINPYLLAGQKTIECTTAREAVQHYLYWDLHLPGDLDNWQVIK